MAEYLTVKDAAKLLQLSQRTILRWVRDGWIRPVRIAHTLRFERGHLLRQLDKYERGHMGEAHDPALG